MAQKKWKATVKAGNRGVQGYKVGDEVVFDTKKEAEQFEEWGAVENVQGFEPEDDKKKGPHENK